jgi:hypothetical protein
MLAFSLTNSKQVLIPAPTKENNKARYLQKLSFQALIKNWRKNIIFAGCVVAQF